MKVTTLKVTTLTPKFGYILIDRYYMIGDDVEHPKIDTVHSDLLWDTADDARAAGEAVAQKDQYVVVIENRDPERRDKPTDSVNVSASKFLAEYAVSKIAEILERNTE